MNVVQFLVALSLAVTAQELFAANIAVKTCGNTPNPNAMPAEWPCEVREIGSATTYTKEPGPWAIMPAPQLEVIKAPLKAAADAAIDALPKPSPVPSVEERLQTLESKVKALERP